MEDFVVINAGKFVVDHRGDNLEESILLQIRATLLRLEIQKAMMERIRDDDVRVSG